jgi:hypothetical protein
MSLSQVTALCCEACSRHFPKRTVRNVPRPFVDSSLSKSLVLHCFQWRVERATSYPPRGAG